MKAIDFNWEMTRAILNGHKRQTRRLVKPQSAAKFQCPETPFVLGVREPWSIVGRFGPEYAVVYQADYPGGDVRRAPLCPRYIDVGFEGPTPRLDAIIHELPERWRPPEEMPLWASRLTLEVTRVRTEQLQSISEADAQDEGVSKHGSGTYRGAFEKLWDSICWASAPWASNPWVWVIEFKEIERKK